MPRGPKSVFADHVAVVAELRGRFRHAFGLPVARKRTTLYELHALFAICYIDFLNQEDKSKEELACCMQIVTRTSTVENDIGTYLGGLDVPYYVLRTLERVRELEVVGLKLQPKWIENYRVHAQLIGDHCAPFVWPKEYPPKYRPPQ